MYSSLSFLIAKLFLAKNSEAIAELDFIQQTSINLFKSLSNKFQEFRLMNAEGVWHTEGRSNDALEVDLWNKVERYIGVPLARLEYCKNSPHALTAFK